MTVEPTERLIQNYLKQEDQTFDTQRNNIVKPLTKHFSKHNSFTLQSLLLNHGLFQSDQTDKNILHEWMEHDLRFKVQQHFEYLKKEWQGPDVKIFILPVDFNNKIITDSFNGVTGLTLAGHVLLFLNHRVDEAYLRAVLAHEYSHSIRLTTLHKNQNLINLKDSIILEGIAEVITLKRYNLSFLPKKKDDETWIKNQFYKWVQPNLSIQSDHPLHHFIMYGDSPRNNRIGYEVGTYIVRCWLKKHPVDIATLLRQPTERFFKEFD